MDEEVNRDKNGEADGMNLEVDSINSLQSNPGYVRNVHRQRSHTPAVEYSNTTDYIHLYSPNGSNNK